MSVSKWIAGNLAVIFWGAILGLIVGFIGCDLESSSAQPFIFNAATSAISGIVVGLIAVNAITWLLNMSQQKS